MHKKSTLRLGLATTYFFMLVCVGELSLGQDVMNRPLELDEYDPCLGPRAYTRQTDRWIVYTDRDRVPVFEDSTCNSRIDGRRLRFLQRFYVLRASSSQRTLYLVRSESFPWDPRIEIKEEIGWVKAEHLVLSPEPVRHGATFIPKKAFIINDWRHFNRESYEDFKKHKVTARAAPSDGARELRTISGMETFTYIYKYDVHGEGRAEDAKWFLVGSSRMLDIRGAERTLIGWVPKSRVAEWDSRIALEPDERRVILGHIYVTENEPLLAERMPEEERARKARLIDRGIKKRWSPNVWRYILLEQPGEAVRSVRVGFQGPLCVYTEGGVDTLSGTGVRDKAMDTWYRIKNINVIFVMDATKSMGPYLSAAAEAAESIMRTVDTTDVNVRFGAVVYRDFDDIPSEQFNQQPLTHSLHEVARFLRNQQEPSTGRDTDYEEALLAGLNLALEDIAREGQTNILIIIGDAGNNDIKGLEKVEIPRLRNLSDSRLPFVFALHLQRPPSCSAERDAIGKFTRDVAPAFQAAQEAQRPVQERAQENWRRAGKKGPMPLIHPTAARETEPNKEDLERARKEVATWIKNIVDLYAKAVRDFAQYMSDGIPDDMAGVPSAPITVIDDPTPYAVTAVILDAMAREVSDPDLFKALVRDKAQIFEPGYVLVNDSLERPVMRPVLLMSEEDLANSIYVLNDLINPITMRDPQTLIRIWEKVMQNYLGTVPDTPELGIRMRYGIQFRGLSKYLGRRFDELHHVSSAEFKELVEEGLKAMDKLNEIKNSPELWFRNYDERYAWVPAEDMP